VLFEEIDESFEAAKKDSNEKVSRLIEDLASASPKALFFFLPVFAGVYAFMFRRTSFYVESFVLHPALTFVLLGIGVHRHVHSLLARYLSDDGRHGLVYLARSPAGLRSGSGSARCQSP
jgi:hypothetical protein